MFALPRLPKVIGAVALGFVALGPLPPVSQAGAADTMTVEETYRDIEATLGMVPSFVREVPAAALPGAWQELKAMEFSETALPAKVKSLISLAVAAQIPCDYCIWLDTMGARAAGATDEEIREAVAVAALARHWSTILNGNQIDFDQLKQEFGAAGDAH